MKIFLRDSFRGEVCAGTPVPIPVDWELGTEGEQRFFIEGTEKQKAMLQKLGMLEEQKCIPDGDKKEEKPPLKLDMPEAPEIGQKVIEQYECKKHKRVHKIGTSDYVACFDANFAQETPKPKKE